MSNLYVKDLPYELWYSCISLHLLAMAFISYYFFIVFFIIWKKIYKTSKVYIKEYKHKLKYAERYNKNKNENKISNVIKDDNNNDNYNNNNFNSTENLSKINTSEEDDNLSDAKKNKLKKKKSKKFIKNTNKNHHSSNTNSNSIDKSGNVETEYFKNTNDINLTNRNLISEKNQRVKTSKNNDHQDVGLNNFFSIMKKIELDKFELDDLDPKKLEANDLRFIYLSYLKVKLFIAFTLLILGLDIYSQIDSYYNIKNRFKDTRFILFENKLVNSIFFDLENKTIGETSVLTVSLLNKVYEEYKYNMNITNRTPTKLFEFFSLNRDYNVTINFRENLFRNKITNCVKYNQGDLENLQNMFTDFFTGSVSFFLYFNIFISMFAFYLNYLRTLIYIRSSIFFKFKHINISRMERLKKNKKSNKNKKKDLKDSKENKQIEIKEKEINLNVHNKNKDNKSIDKLTKNEIVPNNNNNNTDLAIENYATLNNLDITANFNSGETNFIVKMISKSKIKLTIQNFFNKFLKENKIFKTENNWLIKIIIFIFSRFSITVFISFSLAEPTNDCFNYNPNLFLNTLISIFNLAKIILVYILFYLSFGYLFIYKKALVVFIKFLYLMMICPFYLCLAFKNFFLKERENMNSMDERIFRKLGVKEEIFCYKSSKKRFNVFIFPECICNSWAERFYSIYTWVFIVVLSIMALSNLTLNLCMHFLWIKTVDINYMKASAASLLGTILSFLLFLFS